VCVIALMTEKGPIADSTRMTMSDFPEADIHRPYESTGFANFLENSSEPMQRNYLLVSAVSYPRCEGIAAYSENPPNGSERRGVASNASLLSEKSSGNFDGADIRVFHKNRP